MNLQPALLGAVIVGVLVVIIAVVVASGRGGDERPSDTEGGGPDGTPTERISPIAATFAGAEELAATLSAAGFPCDAGSPRFDQAQGGIESSSCIVNGDFAVFSVYYDVREWEQFVLVLEHDPVYEGSVWLVGPNWGIGFDSAAVAKQVQVAIGGRVIVGQGE